MSRIFVEGDEPERVHRQMAETLDKVIASIRSIQPKHEATGQRSVRAGR